MKAWNLKLTVTLTILLVGAIAVAGDWNPVGSSEMSAQNCDLSMCPPGCCTAECFDPCNLTMSWEKLQWQGVRYDEKGHIQKQMSARQAMNIGRQYLEKYNYEANLKLVEGDNFSYKFEVIDSIFKGKMLEVNRKNGWVRQYDSC